MVNTQNDDKASQKQNKTGVGLRLPKQNKTHFIENKRTMMFTVLVYVVT